jgi:hypothetical protein
MLDRETAECELNELPSDFAVGTSGRSSYQGRCTVKPSFKRGEGIKIPQRLSSAWRWRPCGLPMERKKLRLTFPFSTDNKWCVPVKYETVRFT